LKRLHPEKLSVRLHPGITPLNPILTRHYTLTHSDTTAELFLAIGKTYAYDEISAMRDEVRAEWVCIDQQYHLYVYLYVGGPFEKNIAAMRNQIFVKELPLALEALRYADQFFFESHPPLDFCPIVVHFESMYPEFNRTEIWGMPEQYR